MYVTFLPEIFYTSFYANDSCYFVLLSIDTLPALRGETLNYKIAQNGC